jgi:ATP-binding cassette, subfamily B, bacterial HlyB/CyaB
MLSGGLMGLQLACQLHHMPVDKRSLLRQFGLTDEDHMDAIDFVRMAQQVGFRVRQKRSTNPVQMLVSYPLPIINIQDESVLQRELDKGNPAKHALLSGASYPVWVVLKRSEDSANVLVFNTVTNQVEEQSMAALGKRWVILAPKDTKKVLKYGLNWFWQSITIYKGLLGQVLLAAFIIQLFGLATPLITQLILDKVIVHQAMTTLQVMAAAYAAIMVFEFLLGLAKNHIFLHTTNKLDAKLSAQLFRHLMALPILFFESRKVGDILSRLRELESIRGFLTQRAAVVIIDAIFSLVFLGMMMLYSVKLALIVVGFVACIAVFYAILTPIFRKQSEEKFQMASANQAFLVETITGIHSVKALAIEGMMQKRWEQELTTYLHANFRLSSLGNVSNSVATLFQRLMTIVVLFWGVDAVLKNQLTVGQLIAFNMFSSQFIGPVLRLTGLWHELQQALIGVERLGDVLHQPTEVESGNAITLPKVAGHIRLDKLSFKYSVTGPLILNQISANIPVGSMVGIIGRSGSGKSTLAKLLQRMYPPIEGTIFIDDVDTRQMNPVWLRQNIGVVLQDNYLFSGTIAENICMPRPDAPPEVMLQAAKLAGAHEFISDFPAGYDTLVGERGGSLSGGQRQRIAIARALITDPSILIFDEATSALDNESEQWFREQIPLIARGRTVIMIAHRLSTLHHCNMIIVMEKGQLVECGTPQELMALNGLYVQLLNAGLTE